MKFADFAKGMTLSVLLLLGAAVHAQVAQYPNKLIKLIVPFPAGGGSDLAGRQIAQQLADQLKVDVIVENQAGAGGGIGAQAAAKAPSDGYTLLLGTPGTQITNKVFFPQLSFDPATDLMPVHWYSSVPNVLIVKSDSQYKRLEDVLEAARRQKGKVTYGSGGAGSIMHLGSELLAEMAGLQFTHVPYKGSAQALPDLIGGRLDFMIDNLASAKTHIASGTVRALAFTTRTRLSEFPNVPTFAETRGLSNYEAVAWTGIFVPKGTDPKVVEILSNALASATSQAALKAKVESSGALYVGKGPRDFAPFLKTEQERWTPIAKKVPFN